MVPVYGDVCKIDSVGVLGVRRSVLELVSCRRDGHEWQFMAVGHGEAYHCVFIIHIRSPRGVYPRHWCLAGKNQMVSGRKYVLEALVLLHCQGGEQLIKLCSA